MDAGIAKILEDLKKRNKKIEDRNAKFKAMPRMKQRVALAKEVLSIIAGHRVRPSRGVYFDAQFDQELGKALPGRWSSEAAELDWQRLLPKMKTCRVCMIGIAAVASIKMRDGAKFSHFGITYAPGSSSAGRPECVNLLSDLFNASELRDMERFFENNSGGVSAMKSVEIFWKHIIKNEGEYNAADLEKAYLKQIERKRRAKTARGN